MKIVNDLEPPMPGDVQLCRKLCRKLFRKPCRTLSGFCGVLKPLTPLRDLVARRSQS